MNIANPGLSLPQLTIYGEKYRQAPLHHRRARSDGRLGKKTAAGRQSFRR